MKNEQRNVHNPLFYFSIAVQNGISVSRPITPTAPAVLHKRHLDCNALARLRRKQIEIESIILVEGYQRVYTSAENSCTVTPPQQGRGVL